MLLKLAAATSFILSREFRQAVPKIALHSYSFSLGAYIINYFETVVIPFPQQQHIGSQTLLLPPPLLVSASLKIRETKPDRRCGVRLPPFPPDTSALLNVFRKTHRGWLGVGGSGGREREGAIC